MAAAARAAADPRVLAAVDAIRVVNMLSWRYRDPGGLLAQRIRAKGPRDPLYRCRRQCAAVPGQSGLPGHPGRPRRRGPARRCRNLAHPNACGPTVSDRIGQCRTSPSRWPRAPKTASRCPALPRSASLWCARPTSTRCSSRRCGSRPGRPRMTTGAASANCGRGSAMWPDESARVERRAVAGRRDRQPGPDNRMISWPYTKLMNSNNMVDQGAALMLTSVGKGALPADPFASAGFSRRPEPIATTPTPSPSGPSSTARRRSGSRASGRWNWPESASTTSTLSTCTRASRRRCRWPPPRSGLPVGDPGRPLTVTGGLTFAGGPWNNYVTHSIATMAERLVANPGQRGLITANGGYLTKHSFGVYGTEPPTQNSVGRTSNPTSTANRPALRWWNGRGGHGRGVDDTVQPDRIAGEGVPRRAHARRFARRSR